jgi:hypothetical protein
VAVFAVVGYGAMGAGEHSAGHKMGRRAGIGFEELGEVSA